MVMFNKKKIVPKVEFISTVLGLEDIEDLKPKQSKHFIPEWFKQMPSNRDSGPAGFGKSFASAKVCPSFPDFFSQGYIIPAWQDFKIKYDKSKETYEYEMPSAYFPIIGTHHNKQFLDHAEAQVNGIPVDFIFKLTSPWKVITQKGYSILQIPLFYHFDNKFNALPGVIDADILHDINIQITYPENTTELFIKRGTPLVMLIPFKRQNYNLEVRYQTDDDIKKIEKAKINLHSMFFGSYRRMQRRRDKDL